MRLEHADSATRPGPRPLGGGRLRLLVSGSAPFDRRLARIVRNLGFNLLEGYGLTETSPAASVAVPGQKRVGTVGKPLKGVEVRIGPNDEILIRGPNVMKGYLNKPKETAEVIDTDGSFHTGDQGKFDSEGNLIITGRIKELIVSSYGKNIAPIAVEQAIAQSKYVEQVMVYGDKKPFLIALVVPSPLALEGFARERGMSLATAAGCTLGLDRGGAGGRSRARAFPRRLPAGAGSARGPADLVLEPAMAIVGIGIDLVDLDRAERLLHRHGERALRRLLFPAERAYVEGMVAPARHFAVRLAAKEAVYKGLQTLPGAAGIGWRDIEVLRATGGRPGIQLHGHAARIAAALGPHRIHVTLTHTEKTAGYTARTRATTFRRAPA